MQLLIQWRVESHSLEGDKTFSVSCSLYGIEWREKNFVVVVEAKGTGLILQVREPCEMTQKTQPLSALLNSTSLKPVWTKTMRIRLNDDRTSNINGDGESNQQFLSYQDMKLSL